MFSQLNKIILITCFTICSSAQRCFEFSLHERLQIKKKITLLAEEQNTYNNSKILSKMFQHFNSKEIAVIKVAESDLFTFYMLVETRFFSLLSPGGDRPIYSQIMIFDRKRDKIFAALYKTLYDFRIKRINKRRFELNTNASEDECLYSFLSYNNAFKPQYVIQFGNKSIVSENPNHQKHQTLFIYDFESKRRHNFTKQESKSSQDMNLNDIITCFEKTYAFSIPSNKYSAFDILMIQI